MRAREDELTNNRKLIKSRCGREGRIGSRRKTKNKKKNPENSETYRTKDKSGGV